MADAIVSKVAGILDDLVKDGKAGAVDGVLYKFRKIVPALQKVIPDAEKRSLESRAIEAWLEDVKAAFYDAEDLLEEWNFGVMRLRETPSKDAKSKRVSTFFSPSYQLVQRLKGIGRRMDDFASRRRTLDLRGYAKDVQVERGSRKRRRSDTLVVERDGTKSAITAESSINVDLRGRAMDVQDERGSRNRERSDTLDVGRGGAKRAITAKRAVNVDLQECVKDERGSRNREQSDSFVYEEEIIGREDAKSAIMRFLSDSTAEERIPILAIWGMDGIGKTALARFLYKDDMVNRHFDLRIWVCVDGICNLKSLLQKITESATTERADGIELEGLQNQLEKRIRGIKYLLVLDSVWLRFYIQWASLKSLLMGGAEGSKILITTRERSIVDLISTTQSYSLEALSERWSLELLMRMACKEEEKTRDPKKLTIRRQIVKKCRGIPLLTRTIRSILFFKKTEAEWLHFEREIPEVSAELDYNCIRSYLKLSYRHLPSHLKQCFASCSLFPKDWVIDKLMLTSLWTAEGFIWPIDNVDRDMEDIAHDYFMDLVRRNFFQDCTKDELGHVTSCKMHGLVNELAHRVAGTECSRYIDSAWSLIDERTCHLSWDSTSDLSQGLPTTLLRAKHLRTLIKTDQTKSLRCKSLVVKETLHELISNFKYLRALGWHDCGIENLPSSICELKHLTYLDLSENEGIIMLPDSMTRLHSLQVLKLNLCCKLIELPVDIRKLFNLRQLEISNCNALSHMPLGLGRLILLHTLTDFLLPGHDSFPKIFGGLGELNRLSNLRGSLRIESKGEINDAVAQANAVNLKEKDSLVSLVLVFAGKESDEVLLKELQPSLNLRSLEIRGYGGTRFPCNINM